MLNITSATNKDIIVIADEGKDIEKYNINVKGGDVTGKRNNKKGGIPFINYNN